MSSPSPRAACALAVLAFALAVGGCGRKGAPEPPPGAPTVKVTRPDGTVEEKPAKPDRPFVLDRLLN
ncbi:lipoprotein [Methylopila musalis]|uniref:Lipoprotein n=1 Tax=Methylopila musalis TaxID=1134781 RepID=A0ABW3ZA70_9HYPH